MKAVRADIATVALILGMIGILRGWARADEPTAANHATAQQEPGEGVPPLLNLDSVEDGTPLQAGDEELAFAEALVKAFKTPQAAFQQSANRGLTYVHLFSEPERHRGEVVHFEGRLKRLLRFEPPEITKRDGVQDEYEGWMMDPDNYAGNPVCVVFTHLPAGLELGDKIDVRVSFDGYFFKKGRYESSEHKQRVAPMLIGHTIVLRASPQSSEEEGALSGFLMTSAWVLIVGTIVVGVALSWWYRRNDRAWQARLAAVRPPTFDESLTDSESRSKSEEEIKEPPWSEA
jgi:hypothetical protein